MVDTSRLQPEPTQPHLSSHSCKTCLSLCWNVFQNTTSVWRTSSRMRPAVTSPPPCWRCSKPTKMRTMKRMLIWPVKMQRYRENEHRALLLPSVLMWTTATWRVYGVLPILQILFEAGGKSSKIDVSTFIDLLTRRSGPQLCKSEYVATPRLQNRFDWKETKLHCSFTLNKPLTQ